MFRRSPRSGEPIIWAVWPMVAVAADRTEQPVGGGGRRILGDRGAHEPGAAVHLEAANVGAGREHRAVGPEAAEALAVLQAGGGREPGAVEREGARTSQAGENARTPEFGPARPEA